jgi:hypothetical protein
MLILGKVVESTPCDRVATRSRFEDVPAPIFGKVPRTAVVKMPARAGCNRM